MSRATYLDMIVHALAARTDDDPHSFQSLRQHVKRMVVSDRRRYNNRAYVAAIRRGVLTGVLERGGGGGGSILAVRGGPPPPDGARMCAGHRSTAGQHRERRLEFTAVVGRRGYKRGSRGVVTVLLTRVRSVDAGADVRMDHVWVVEGSSFAACREGDRVRFDARVRLYHKSGGMDYKLFYPTKVQIVC
jgi:hypothetical protein